MATLIPSPALLAAALLLVVGPPGSLESIKGGDSLGWLRSPSPEEVPVAQPLTLRPGTEPSLGDPTPRPPPPQQHEEAVRDRIGTRWANDYPAVLLSRRRSQQAELVGSKRNRFADYGGNHHWANDYPAEQHGLGSRPAGHYYSTKLNRWHEHERSRTTERSPDALVFADSYQSSSSSSRGSSNSSSRQRPLVWGAPTPEYSDSPALRAQATGPSRPRPHRRVSERKCAEFAKLQTERVVALPLVPNPKPSVNHVQKCEQNTAPLVVGGQDARLHEFPHMAALGYTGAGGRLEWNCGGSLISDMFVLTAAHCTATAQGPPKVVRLGDHNLDSGDDGTRALDVTVSSMVRHPDYRPPARYHDIGLLRLSRKVPFSSAIRPACLYTGDHISEPLIATGWGLTEQLGERSQVLQKVILNFVEHDTCSSLYAADATTSSLSRGIVSDSQLCAGVLTGGMDTCQGDSGGPLQITSHNNQCVFYVVGVTSFGKVCAARNSPGVYTRVSKYALWIERHVWPQEKFDSFN